MTEEKELKLIDELMHEMDVTPFSRSFISNLIRNRMADLNFNVIDDYVAYFEVNKSESELFRSQLSNSYSMFFRNRLTFEVLAHIVIPACLQKSNSISEMRVWSAGCAAGHEAYSLAILFESFNNVSSKQLKYRIFATDKNYKEIEKAVMGDYQFSDLGNLTVNELDKWFTQNGNKYKLNASIKQFVQFELFDLLNEDCICPKTSIFGDFDLIMCANVLIYYNPEVQKKIISNFKKCIASDGYVITGEVERDLFLQNGFIEIYPQSSVFRLKL